MWWILWVNSKKRWSEKMVDHLLGFKVSTLLLNHYLLRYFSPLFSIIICFSSLHVLKFIGDRWQREMNSRKLYTCVVLTVYDVVFRQRLSLTNFAQKTFFTVLFLFFSNTVIFSFFIRLQNIQISLRKQKNVRWNESRVASETKHVQLLIYSRFKVDRIKHNKSVISTH